jgi:hypothetical protein
VAVPSPSAATAPQLQIAPAWILAIAGLAFGCLVIFGGLALLALNRTAPAAPPPTPTVIAEVKPKPQKHEPESEPAIPVVVPPPAPMPEDPDAAFKPLKGSVYLLAVENVQQQKTWSFATACAIRPDTLICCANAAVELVTLKSKGLKCWAKNQSTLTNVEISDIHVHALFQKMVQDFSKRTYFDFALLTVQGKLPQTAPMAATEELDDLKAGSTVVAMSIPHPGELMDRFQSFSPVVTRGKVFIVTSLPPAPGPRLMHVKAIPEKIYGSPVFNEEGKLVGVYSDVAVPPPSQPPVADLHLQLVPVLSPELIASWFEGTGKEIWVTVTVPDAAPQATTAPHPKRKPKSNKSP